MKSSRVRILLALTLVGVLASLGRVGLDRAPGRPPDLRIAVVGAGASGLLAAHTLARLGYGNVTVFERNDRVGGKVRSHAEGDLRGVELGAYCLSPRHGEGVVLALAEELGVRTVPDKQPKFIVGEDGQPRSFDEHLRHHYTPEQIASATERYAEVLETFAAARSRFTDLHPDLAMPFDAFAEKYGFTPIARLGRAFMVGFGYAYYEKVPAAFMLRILPVLVPLGPAGVEEPRYVVFPRPGGFQGLWEAVAAPLDVRLNAEVTKISRAPSPGPGGVRLTINGEEDLSFDRVIISAPLKEVPTFLDVTDEERDLFARVRSNHFFVTFFAAPGLTRPDVWFFDANGTPDRINHVAAWADTGLRVEVSPSWLAPVYVAYQTAEWSATPQAVSDTLRSDVAAAGGLFAKVLLQADWSYMPHVGSEDLAAGFFDRVEALQGQLGTYYVGSALSFETVEESARYARDLVTARFPDRNP